jgi:hypothetical protein
MAKRKLLQWMRDRLCSHADKVVIPVKQHRALEAAYAKALPLVRAMADKKFPPSDMKVLTKYAATCIVSSAQITFPDGSVRQFTFRDADKLTVASGYSRHMYLADAKTAAAIDAWQTAEETFKSERNKRLAAYKAMIAGSSFVEDVIEVWPEAKGVLPVGSPPIALGPEQFATIRADQSERKAA